MSLQLSQQSVLPVTRLVLEFTNSSGEIKWGDKNELLVGDIRITSDNTIAKYFANKSPAAGLYGIDELSATEVDHWLEFATVKMACASEQQMALDYLEKVLGPSTFLVQEKITLADLAVWNALRLHSHVIENGSYTNINRYYRHLNSMAQFKAVTSMLLKNKPAPDGKNKTKKKDEGKFVELDGAKHGEVVVRFPPEASGYLHIGHAKAALLNQYYQQTFAGKLIMRFDDTNPAKENAEFEKIILEDVKLLGINYDSFSYTSQHFDRMLELCEQMIKQGDAFVDDTDGEMMKQERSERKNSRHRDNSVETNLKMWTDMKAGTEYGQRCCVRAKIDMQSDNGCLRDPTMYRCKPEVHPHTGDKYKVYPTYDFACPIVDSVEGVTHALRTTEYLDRDDQYYWFLEKLRLRRPVIWAYSRLNLQHTVLSKRKLTWFVNEGYVTGWDDPRFPTVRGVLRRGMTVEGLKQFIIAQGGSRSVVTMEWDKIWSFNKKVIDPIAPRYFALLREDMVPVYVEGATDSSLQHPKHPKNPDVGQKTVYYSGKVYIDGADAVTLKERENVTFINWGNLIITSIKRNSDNKVESVNAKLNLDNKDFKQTVKITWLADHPEACHVETLCVHYGDLLTKPVLAPDDDFKTYINHDSKTVYKMLGDSGLAELKKGDIIQLQRRGYYICDRPAGPLSLHTSSQSPCILINIPDGHQKEMPTAGSKHKQDDKTSKKQKSTGSSQNVSAAAAASLSAADINDKIKKQGDMVRKLKGEKASKGDIDSAVKILLSLKADYKAATGTEWKPGVVLPQQSGAPASTGQSAADIHEKITKQGDLVRNLKSKKADKAEIDSAVKVLLSLKADYKAATGTEWKPGVVPPSAAPQQSGASAGAGQSAADIHEKITKQGDLVRSLKSKNADKAEIDSAVKVLLSLKADYKAATGTEWKPGTVPPSAAPQQSGAPAGTGQSAADIHDKITKQGDLVRSLKSKKADKAEIDSAVKVLLSLKADYKTATGTEWKPGTVPPSAAPQQSGAPAGTGQSAADIHEKITKQGDLVRSLKSKKADKAEIDSAVKVLLSLKADYKTATGTEWKPGTVPPSAAPQQSGAPAGTGQSVADIHEKITKQGDLVRKLKSEKAEKSVIDKEVAQLLSLKAAYKQSTGMDYKPGSAPPAVVSKNGNSAADELNEKITSQSNQVRQLKGDKASKEQIDAAVKVLLELKGQYKSLTENEWKPAGGSQQSSRPKKEKTKQAEPKPDNRSQQTTGDREVKKVTGLGVKANKEENFSDWYSQVITKAEMIEYYDISGCYILRPWSFSIWDIIKDFFDKEIKKLGVENCYFPIFVSHAALEKEKTHIADFAPEVAWVTKSGSSDLAEPIAIRPTSETVMYPAYARWIQSYRDLPLRLNQWNNVVRWEFKHPQPFLRTREFLWQEGHTAFANNVEAEKEVHQILDLYAQIYEDYLAVPVVKGRKTEKEKFAGGDFTTTVEAYIPVSGRAIQGATSHHLGQNFSKMFNIVFEHPETLKPEYVWQNSWGITTRTIGVMVMVHGDNRGLVLPPKVASIQVIIVPCGITANLSESDKKAIIDGCQNLESQLKSAEMRVKADLRDNYSPGWKFNHWEQKGVPLRIELGPRDIKQGKFVAVRRDNGDKSTENRTDAVKYCQEMLKTIQDSMFSKAKKEMDSHIVKADTWEELCAGLDKSYLLLSPFCGETSCEDVIKKDSARDVVVEEGAPAMGAKGLCIPFDRPDIKPDTKCILPACKNKPRYYTLFGRSY